ncbi:MAG: carboxypeptidase-like regulatory domain-containing protein [Acidobacteria bacterium]|nr:carboxypeptidase-like regulatory domain-containing protein [Acidobacteriota bacterium]
MKNHRTLFDRTCATFLALLIVWLSAIQAFGQESRGTIIGRVADSTGAALAGVKVDITSAATNVTSTVTTNDEGRFSAPFLFSDLLKINSTYQLYNPFTTRPATTAGRFQRDPFPNNVIPTNLLNPVALNLLKFYPLPNQTGTADGRNNFFQAYKILESYDVYMARMDHAFSEKHRMFARVHYDTWTENKSIWRRSASRRTWSINCPTNPSPPFRAFSLVVTPACPVGNRATARIQG